MSFPYGMPPAGAYQGLPLEGSRFSDANQGMMSRALENSSLVRAESMDLCNDPRFFTDNVIDKRLAAFAGLTVVSGLMVQNAIDQSFGMKKDMNFHTVEGWSQCVGFVVLSGVLFANVLATYIGVAQPYHTYRLMTAGPAGFETAAAYYLNKNIVSFRHASVKLMLLSLPWFMVSSGFRFVPKFARDAVAERPLPDEVPFETRVIGGVVFGSYLIIGISLAYVHREHQAVFQQKYESMWHASGMGTILSQVQHMMSPGPRQRHPVDV